MFSKNEITTPVLFLIYNRPSLTQKVFNVIRDVQPSRLFIAADGPRPDKPDDITKCRETRQIVKQIDWDCEVETLFRESNLGCRIAISSAIDWFFENVEEGIILEDDCLPSRSFFWFCQELLGKYRGDESIMQINGNYYLSDMRHFDESYYFSTLNSCWGWATWKSRWRHFDDSMKGYSQFKEEEGIESYFNNKEISDWMISYLDEAIRPSCGIWSTQWAYAIIKQNGLSISPTANLVQNIGFNENATSGYHESFSMYTAFQAEEMDEIVHPFQVFHDADADALHFASMIKTTDPRCIDTHGGSFMSVVKRSVHQAIKTILGQLYRNRMKGN